MNKTALLLLLTIIVFNALSVAQDEGTIEMNEKLNFLIGKWKTVSTIPNGEHYNGDLEYQWIMDHNWIKVTFIGQHPSRPYWEAHGFIKYDQEVGKYVSYVIFNRDNPKPDYGYWVDEKTFRFGSEKQGIDYIKLKDGGCLQKNFRVDASGKRIDVLVTTYEKVK